MNGSELAENSKPATWARMIPVRASEWREGEGGVTLLVPRFGRGRFGTFLEEKFRPRPYRVQLDAVGSFIWKQCDGKSRVEEIGQALHGEFGERVEPVEGRLVKFLQRLVRGKFVRLDSNS